MPSDIRSFFGGKPAGTPAVKEEPPKPAKQKGRGKRVIEDDSDDEVAEVKPKKSTPRKKAKQPDPPPAEEATTTSSYFGNKTKPKRSEPVRAKPAADADVKTPAKKSSKPAVTPTKPAVKDTPTPRTSARKKHAPVRLVNGGSSTHDDLIDDVDFDEGDDIFKDEFKNGPRKDDYKEESEDEEDETEAVAPKATKRTRSTKSKKKEAEHTFEPVDGDDDDDEDMIDAVEHEKPSTMEHIVKDKTAPKASTSSRKRKAPTPDEEDPTVQSIFDDIPLVRPPTPPPQDGEKPKFKYRPGGAAAAPPPAAGSKDIPSGAENCLAGLTFVFTGILESLDRDTGKELVKQYGGKVQTAPSTRTSYVVLGNDAGPKKLEVIRQNNIKTINEDGLFELIRRLPANGGSGKAAVQQAEKKAAEEKNIRDQAAIMAKEEKESMKNAAKKAGTSRADSSSQLWTTKYAPTKLSDICGNKATVERLAKWLRAFPKNLRTRFKMPGPDGSGTFRAVMIHGPPGIGKTTAAHLVAQLEGYDVVESNASDTRSKKLVETGLKGVLSTTSLLGYFAADDKKVDVSKKKLVLIMDEVDGMSAGDRGGVGALAALCKKTSVPMILICNERRQPKMKPFDFVTFDLPFRRPTVEMIRSRIMTILFREELKMPPNVVNALIEGTHADIRQVINMISTAKLDEATMDYERGKDMSKAWEKHVILKPWDLVGKILGGGMFAASSKATIQDKAELYFGDHDFSYLMLQENYLGTTPTLASSVQDPKLRKLKTLELAQQAAEGISDGDLVDRMIHGSQQHWSLMPVHAIMSFVRPASFVAGSMAGHRTGFTSWMGKNSTQQKLMRMVKEIQGHMRLHTSADRHEIRQQYLPLLWRDLVDKLQRDGKDAVDAIIDLMDSYYLTKDDFDAIMELGVGPMSMERVKIESQAKATFTRLYNLRPHPVPFMKASNVIAPKRLAKVQPDLEEAIEAEEDNEILDDAKVDEDDEGDVTKDKYIKQPKKKKAAAASKGKGKKAAAAADEDDEDDDEEVKPKKGKGAARGRGKGRK